MDMSLFASFAAIAAPFQRHLLSLSLAFLLVVIGTRVGLFASFVEIGLGGRSLSDVVGDKPAVLTEALIQGGAKNCMHGSKTVMENMGGALTPGETASFSQECNPPPEVGGAGDGERARIVAECSLTLSTFDTDEDEELTYKEARGAREKLRVHVGRIPTARCTLPLDAGLQCFVHAGDDGVIAPSEYSDWLGCQLKPLTVPCLKQACAAPAA